MEIDIRRATRGAIALFAAAAFVLVAGPAEAALRVDLEDIRSYDVPSGFDLEERIVRGGSGGTTLIAGTTGAGRQSACTVVVAAESTAKAFPYRHSEHGSRCLGALPHPEGGFFVRGFQGGAEPGEIAGFTARIASDGAEEWLLQDVEIAGHEGFRGEYRQPHAAMTYSETNDALLVFTLGRLTIGEIDEKEVTNASVIEDGRLRIPAKRLGSSGGFGVLGGLTTLEASGDFLLYMVQPGTDGAEFFTYDGRENVDAFRPADEDWSERFVRQLARGPEGNLYLLWTDDAEEEGPTWVTVVDAEGEPIWEEEYDAEFSEGGDSLSLGTPSSMWVGNRYVVVLYETGRQLLRAIDTETGEELGVAPLEGATELRPLNILKGGDGRLRVLATGADQRRFHELEIEFVEESRGGDAGLPDGGFADVRGEEDGANAGSGGANGGSGGGCALSGRRGPGAPVGALILLAPLLALRRSSGRS